MTKPPPQLRAAIIGITRETDLKVLVCHEDQTQIQLGKEMVVDPLPGDVKKKVVWRDRFWLTDEALSTYVRSAGLFGTSKSLGFAREKVHDLLLLAQARLQRGHIEVLHGFVLLRSHRRRDARSVAAYTLGLFHFLATDESVPEKLRDLTSNQWQGISPV